MGGCRHSDWVELSATTRHLRLSDPARLHRLIGELERAAKQHPHIVLCLGKEERRKLISQILLGQRVTRPFSTRKSPAGGISSIVSDKSQAGVDHPIFFAHTRVEGAIPTSRGYHCHETRSARNGWPASQQGAYDAILTKLFFPFSNLICMFVEDFGGFDAVLDRLNAWTSTPRATDLADFAREALPRVCLITSGPLSAEAQIREEAAHSRLDRIDFHDHFSNVQILRFDTNSLEEFYEDFRLLLLNELTTSNLMKERHRVSFSARHLAEFFSKAILHVGTDPTKKFSFISASRTHRSVPPSDPDQVGVVLRSRAKHGVGFDKVASLISSCLLLDAYPRGSHAFDACDIFQELYAEPLGTALQSNYAALSHPGERRLQNTICKDGRFKILVKFVTMARRSDGTRDWALRQHKNNLSSLWLCDTRKLMVSAQICVSCLAGSPHHVLECGHILCDQCVGRFGRPWVGEEYRYAVEECVICRFPVGLVVHLKPPTAGPRILTIDGGGVRGVAPLEVLNKLQKDLGPRARVQDFFDLAFGVSAGGLVILGMFAKQWSVDHCTRSFCEVAQQIFAPSRGRMKGLLGLAHTLTCCLLHDGLYGSEMVDSLLQESFGAETRVLSPAPTRVSRHKYAVTTTKVDDTAASVLSNYSVAVSDDQSHPLKAVTGGINGSKRQSRSSLSTYHRHRSSHADESPFLWKVAKATSAAPPFFEPVAMGEDGVHRDGGYHNLNNTHIAIADSLKIWPGTLPAVILSLGTGQTPRAHVQKQAPLRGKIQNGTLARLLRWSRARLMEAIDGEEVHERVCASLDDTRRTTYFRMNPEFPDGLPRLDDVEQIQHIREHVKSYPSKEMRTEFKIALIASSFFFELCRTPKHGRAATYLCEGTIRIRGDPNLVLELLLSLNYPSVEFTSEEDELGEVCLSGAICPTCKMFAQHVQFHVRDRDKPHTIYIKLDKDVRYPISGFPQTMSWFCEQQGLFDAFSTGSSERERCVCDLLPELPKLDDRKRRASSQQLTRQASNHRKAKKVKYDELNPAPDVGCSGQ